MLIGLIAVAVVVTLFPLFLRKVKDNLELFFLVMGIAAVTVASQWRVSLLLDALRGPLKITLAVLLSSLFFHFIQEPLERGITRLRARMGPKLIVVAIIAMAGIFSSLLTAIITSLIMVEAVSRLKLGDRTQTRVVVFACFSIGFGSALTPFGGPLATVAVAKLAGEPYRADTWFLLRHLWMFALSAIALVSAASIFYLNRHDAPESPVPREERETFFSVIIQTVKIYIFVLGLILIGAGFTPLVERFIGSIPYWALFWANITSAVLDNATLIAAEIVPSMQMNQIVAAVMGCLIAGGLLVPGNIPNIIAARRLKIDNLEWVKAALPIGMAMMIVMFVILLVMR
jgi:predicted cation transporter